MKDRLSTFIVCLQFESSKEKQTLQEVRQDSDLHVNLYALPPTHFGPITAYVRSLRNIKRFKCNFKFVLLFIYEVVYSDPLELKSYVIKILY